MARKVKRVKVDDREIEVRELTVADIRKLFDRAMSLEGGLAEILEALKDLLPMVTDLKPKDFDRMTPSELRVLYEAFREVNADFFGTLAGLRKMGLLPAPPTAQANG